MRLAMLLSVLGCAFLSSVLGAQATESKMAIPSRPPRLCSGGSGGGTNLSDRVTAAYSTITERGNIRLELAILARGQPGWDHGSGRASRSWPPVLPVVQGDLRPQLSGATADTFALLFDRANDIAWVGGRRVPLAGNNVVLFDRADGVGGAPEVLPLLRVEPRITVADSVCRMPFDSIRGMLLRNAEVRAFLKP